jgi:hypothetical protein
VKDDRTTNGPVAVLLAPAALADDRVDREALAGVRVVREALAGDRAALVIVRADGRVGDRPTADAEQRARITNAQAPENPVPACLLNLARERPREHHHAQLSYASST